MSCGDLAPSEADPGQQSHRRPRARQLQAGALHGPQGVGRSQAQAQHHSGLFLAGHRLEAESWVSQAWGLEVWCLTQVREGCSSGAYGSGQRSCCDCHRF